MVLMFFLIQGFLDFFINLVDLILNHKIRQISLDLHQVYLHLLVEKEQDRWIDRVRDHHHQSLNFFRSDGDDDQPPETVRQRQPV